MKRLALFTLCLGFALAAGAQTPAPADPAVDTTVPEQSAAQSQDAVAGNKAKDKLADRNCLKETGSRIKPHADRKGRRCINAPGASYDREDLDRTGATDIKDALRRLDPTVR